MIQNEKQDFDQLSPEDNQEPLMWCGTPLIEEILKESEENDQE